MANKDIPSLPAAGAAAASDLYETSQGGVSKKETGTQVATMALALGKVRTTGRVNQGMVAFGTPVVASHSGLFQALVDIDGSAGPASINLEINAVLEYQVSANLASMNMIISYYVNAGDSINLVNFSDPAGTNQLEDNYILPFLTVIA